MSPRWQRPASLGAHAALALLAPDRAHPFFLLLDRADGAPWMWQATLRYLNRWAKRSAGAFPPLLIICPSAFRARAMLRLARMTAPALTVAATGEREIALNEGLLAVAQHPKGWLTLLPNGRFARVDPFALPGLPRDAYERSSFAIDKLRRRAERAAARAAPPADAEAIARFEALTDAQHALLAFICRNPVAPESAVATLLGVPLAEVQRDILALESAGFAQRAQSKIAEPIWAASDTGAALRFTCEMQPPNHLRRYGFFRADHERRLTHTLAVYRFFEALKLNCDRRSRAARKLDAQADGPSDGRVPMFALAAFESEFMASDWFTKHGQTRFWRPDGYGALRAGKLVTHFWLELDGTASAPSRSDPAVWQGKLARLCDYIATRRWTLRYPRLPRTLVVTTDLRNSVHIYDALVEAARARGMRELPRVLVASSDAVQQRGPLAKVWRDVAAEDDDLVYAFDGLAPHELQPRGPKCVNVLDELQRAEALGLLDGGR